MPRLSLAAATFGRDGFLQGEFAEQRSLPDSTPTLEKRVAIPVNTSTAPPGLIEAVTKDPWSQADKYSRGWIYFSVVLLTFAIMSYLYKIWTDKIRLALHKEEALRQMEQMSPDTFYEMTYLETDKSTNKLFPRDGQQAIATAPRAQSSVSSIGPLNNLIATFRFIFYRPLPVWRVKKNWRPISFPSLSVVTIVSIALIFTILYTFIPQPLYWENIAFGSPPVAIRSGMLAVAMMPWLVALSMKANLITMITGIGHERLNVLHRWGGWLCLLLSLIHTIPFYVQPINEPDAYNTFRAFFSKGIYVFGTGWAALAPLLFLCLHSLPMLRNWMYELFVAIHVPAAMIFLGMMFWHCNNYLTSWDYLWSTLAIWILSYIVRFFFYLNWTRPMRLSWLIGDEASVVLMHENALKVTIATQTKWKPGQYVYLRMPGISIFENHPFTIASLCSEDFPSAYGEGFHDMSLVFRPFGGFTKKVLEKALEKGPWHSYRAFIDGPYGGMQRSLDAFDHVVLIAGGSGVTALVSHLLQLIKRLREDKACTKSVHVIWALKRPEILEWFKDELSICREYAPENMVRFQFFITAAKRMGTGQLVSAQTPGRPMSTLFHDKVNDAFQGIANKRVSHISEVSANRRSAFIKEEAGENTDYEKELRRENEDAITALPQAHLVPAKGPRATNVAPNQPIGSVQEKRKPMNLRLSTEEAMLPQPEAVVTNDLGGFNFGFPSTPTEFQKNLMRFAFLPSAVKRRDGWSIEYGRPDLPYMLRQSCREDFGKRTCVFVCGPPSMRVTVQRSVANLQREVIRDPLKDELYLHTENYSL